MTHGDAEDRHGQGHLAHHFDTTDQQFSSSKLGMWLFLGTELLMFGGLFCAYAIYRANHPEIFRWARVLLDRKMGALNTLILISSSFTMATAVRCAQSDQRKRLVLFLSLTFLGACGFLTIKFLEYRPKFEHGLLWGRLYAPDAAYVAHHYGVEAAGHGKGAKAAAHVPDVARGQKIAMETCASCHGKDLHGLPKNGLNLVASKFVGSKTDDELVDFVKVGRPPWDPANTTKVQMPPRGGNPTLTDDKLHDVVAYLRTVWKGPGAETTAVAQAAAPTDSSAAAPDIPKSVLPPAASPPEELATPVPAAPAEVPMEPKNVQQFFGIYFLMTGLHAIHVIAGMCVIGWLIVGAARGRYGSSYYTPVDLGGLFWHLVDLIWIFLFPLFYLI
ncbi:MAG: cytochrome c oxidase subunit 3 [bacterium]